MLPKKCGHPLLIGDNLDAQVKAYVRASRAKGCVVNASLVIAGGIGIVKKSNPDLLKDDFRRDNKEFLSKSWAKSLLGRMGYVKQGNVYSQGRSREL